MGIRPSKTFWTRHFQINKPDLHASKRKQKFFSLALALSSDVDLPFYALNKTVGVIE